MRLEQLTARAFRNLKPLSLSFPARVNLFVGANGQGKTNILEAVYLSATGRSFRQATPHEMLQFGASEGRVAAILTREHVRHQVHIGLTSKARLLRVDERPIRRLSTLFELINMVSFFPDDLTIAKGSPEGRRKFFDRAVASLDPSYIDVAINFQRALKNRNAVLRSANRVDRGLLSSFDSPVIQWATAVHKAREEALRRLKPLATLAFSRFCPAAVLNLRLDEGLDSSEIAGPEAYSEALKQTFDRNFEKDRARGSTSSGPHRSDLICEMDEQDMRRYASQGQQRALVLALKVAELRAATHRLGSPPLLLLDDVSSELDTERTERLFAEITDMGCQTFVTTTGTTQLPAGADLSTYKIECGIASLVSDKTFQG